MILRLFEHAAKFDCEGTLEYFDIKCDSYQVTNGVLHIMRFKAQDVFIPLSSIKMFKQMGPKTIFMPAGHKEIKL